MPAGRGRTTGTSGTSPTSPARPEFPHVAADVNFWKSFVHEHLAIAPGDVGSLTIFGSEREHELFAQHIAKSETWVQTEGWGRKVREWSPLPGKPDNYWLDCLVGCAVAASLVGLRVPGQDAGRTRRQRIKLSELQGSAR